MALTDLQVYIDINDASTGLKKVADDIETKYVNPPYSYTGIDTRVATIKTALDAIWVLSRDLVDDHMTDGSFTTGNMCGLVGLALTDSDDAMEQLLGGTGEVGESKFLDPHIVNHMATTLSTSASEADTQSKLDHIITDLANIDTGLTNFTSEFLDLENLLKRVNRSIAVLGFSLSCATGIIDELAGTNMRNLFDKLGTGSTQADKRAKAMNKTLNSVNTYSGESNLLTRLNNMRSDMKGASPTGDDWDSEMTTIKTNATTERTAFMAVTALP